MTSRVFSPGIPVGECRAEMAADGSAAYVFMGQGGAYIVLDDLTVARDAERAIGEAREMLEAAQAPAPADVTPMAVAS